MVTDACLDGLAARIAASFGVDFSGFRRASLADAVRARVGETTRDCEALLRAGLEALLPVVEAALNGETYFLRHGGHFDALRREVLPRLYASRAGTRRLRVWSAGCSSGEEALSLAMVLLETAPGPDWDLQVLGTDLSREALHLADQAAYGEWSFRGVPQGVRGRYFTREGGTWHPVAALRDRVRYRRHNLLDGPPDRFDLVVCRNVLIYFQDPLLGRAAETLVAGVARDGWLLTGPAEARPELFGGLEPVHLDDALLFCRPGPAFVAPAAQASVTPRRSRFTRSPTAEARAPAEDPGLAPTADPPAAPPPAAIPGDLDAALREIHALADRGDHEAAWRLVEATSQGFSLSPRLHLVRALLARALGDAGEALRSATAALFLDPDLALASVVAGDLLQARGDHEAAARAYRNALESLSELDPAGPVPHGDGVTAEGLSHRVSRSLAALGPGRKDGAA